MRERIAVVLGTFLTTGGTGLFFFLGDGSSGIVKEDFSYETPGIGRHGSLDKTSDSLINSSGNKNLGEEVKEKGKKWLEENKKYKSSSETEEGKAGEELDTIQEIGSRVRRVSFDGENSEKDKGVGEAEIIGTRFSDGFKLSEENEKSKKDIGEFEFEKDFLKTQNFGFRTNGVWGPGFDDWAKTNLGKNSGDLELNIQSENGKVVGFHEYSIGKGTSDNNEKDKKLGGDKSGNIKGTVIGRDLDLERGEVNDSDQNTRSKDICVGNLGKKEEKEGIPSVDDYGTIVDLPEMNRFSVMNDFRSRLGELVQMDNENYFGLKEESDDEKEEIFKNTNIQVGGESTVDRSNIDVGTQGNGKMMCVDSKSLGEKSLKVLQEVEVNKPKKGWGEGKFGGKFLFEKKTGEDKNVSDDEKKKFKGGWGWKRHEIFEIVDENSEKEYKNEFVTEWEEVEKKENNSPTQPIKEQLKEGIISGNGGGEK